MTKASLALLCLIVGAISAAEIDFKQNRANVGRPVVVPVVPNQIKRQGDYNFGSNNGVRSVNSNSFRQSSESQVPLQQPYRTSAESPSSQRQGATGGRPKQVSLEQSKTSSSVNSEPSSAFQQRTREPSHPPPSEEIFAPFTAENSRPSSSRPFRQSNSRPFSSSSSLEQRQAGSNGPQFEGGFPDGFTSGLPAFDFQGRMPEPDNKSEGFMDGALNGFPNLKSFGGFGPLPEVSQEDSIVPKQRQGSGRPDGFRLGQQPKRRPQRDVYGNRNVSINTKKRFLRNDDEALLEPDIPSPSGKTRPTDIADIIGDLTGSEQRFTPSFEFTPSQGPYGRNFRPPAIIPPPQISARRPVNSAPSFSVAISNLNNNNNNINHNRPLQRTPLKPQFEFVDDNSILGSGHFDILTGGVFREAGDSPKYNNYFTLPNNLRQLAPNSSPFAQQPAAHPPTNNHPSSIHSQQQNYHNNAPPSTYNPFPNSFFGDDDFFSNFRDFADVNQDYRDVTPDFHNNRNYRS